MAKQHKPAVLPGTDRPRPSGYEEAVRRIEGLPSHPLARLVTLVWAVVVTVISAFSFYETRFASPARLAKLEEKAAREGWGEDPRVFVRFAEGRCTMTNEDGRPVDQARILAYSFPVNLSRACGRPLAPFSGGQVRASAAALGSYKQLREPTPIPSVEPHTCPPGEDCLIAIECRGEYRRPSDQKLYRKSGWAILDPKTGSGLVPLESLVKYRGKMSDTSHVEPEWKDARYRSAFECVRQAAEGRDNLDSFMESVREAQSEIVTKR